MKRTPRAEPRRPPPEQPTALIQALEELAGAAMVLDEQLRILAATAAVEQVLGVRPRVGLSAPKLMCGEAEERPLAEALAAGRAIRTSLVRPRPGREDAVVEVRALPLAAGSGHVGWLLLLRETPEATPIGEVVQFQGMATREPAVMELFRIVRKVARTETTVLVRGETGSGKELIANAIHALSPRGSGPFRALNCAALPANLLESELFGHVKGAFTGAVRDTPGHIELAHGGTLFLDEVAELPLPLQAKLLRVLETHTVLSVGGREPIPVDVRIVSATHRSLRREVEAGNFRADLMFRLRVIPIFLPPLRSRPADILLLARRFIDELNGRGGRQVESIGPGAARLLERHDWPGNIRELRNVVEYAFAIGEGPVLLETDLPPELGDQRLATGLVSGAVPVPPLAPPGGGEAAERQRILRALERTAGNRERAAQILGISRVTLWRRLKELGLDRGDGG